MQDTVSSCHVLYVSTPTCLRAFSYLVKSGLEKTQGVYWARSSFITQSTTVLAMRFSSRRVLLPHTHTSVGPLTSGTGVADLVLTMIVLNMGTSPDFVVKSAPTVSRTRFKTWRPSRAWRPAFPQLLISYRTTAGKCSSLFWKWRTPHRLAVFN